MGRILVKTFTFEEEIGQENAAPKPPPKDRSHLWYLLCLIPIVAVLHFCRAMYFDNYSVGLTWDPYDTSLAPYEVAEGSCKSLVSDLNGLRQEMEALRKQMVAMEAAKRDEIQELTRRLHSTLDEFSADQIGIFDYASEYAGGSVVSTPNTRPYPSSEKLRLFGSIDWAFASRPHFMLQRTEAPGHCFAFYGGQGRIRVKLGQPVVISDVSVEHIKLAESRASAPEVFEVFGLLKEDDVTEFLGKFTYNINGRNVQTFSTSPSNKTFPLVELQILSNHGAAFTCIYRFRVHSRHLPEN